MTCVESRELLTALCDSGGPHVLHNVIVSVTSNGDGNCVATDNTQRIDQPIIRDWILSYLD